MAHRFDPAHLERLEAPWRASLFPVAEVLRGHGIGPGARVLDVGTGSGFFLPFLSREVGPKGLVVGVDVEPRALAAAEKKVAAGNLRNVRLQPIEEDGSGLGESGFDAAFLAFTFHEVADPRAFLGWLRGILVPAGRVLIVDWNRAARDKGPPASEVHPLADIVAFLVAAGFEAVRVREFPPYCHLVSGAGPTVPA